jgi:2-methylcitrate dehydratase PrpD
MQQTAPNPDDTDLTLALAEEMNALTPDALSPEDVAQLRRLLLDHLGVCLRGSDLPWGRALTEWAGTYAGTGPCVIFGTDLQTTAPVAALVNATAAHGLEMDDTHDISVSHPGAPVIATALAVGAQEGRGGGEIMAAIAAGYEVMGRIGPATDGGNMIERGFHPTALFGGFGAATAAGKLYGLDAAGLCRAWGLMLSMAGGSMQFAHDPEGTTVKRLHGGYGAHNGTMAAQFARLGIDGPKQAFDGVYGLANLYGPSPQPDCLRRAPGAPREIHRISMKPYPCCRLFHSTIDALRETTDGLTMDPDRIAGIRVGGPVIMVTQHMMRRPTSVMAAQYSLPFALSASLITGPSAYESYAEDELDNAAVLALGDRVEAVQDDGLEDAFPAHFGSWVELTTTDGETRRADVLDSYGTPARPMPDDALRDKFEGLTMTVQPDLPLDKVYAAVEGFDALETPDTLTRLFARA